MIFISSPYTHKDKKVEHQRYVDTCKYAAYLFTQQKMAVSPVIVGHPLLEHEKLPGDFTFWKDYSFELLKGCSELHVLMLEGWDASVGIQHEIIFADQHEIPVKYFMPQKPDGKKFFRIMPKGAKWTYKEW